MPFLILLIIIVIIYLWSEHPPASVAKRRKAAHEKMVVSTYSAGHWDPLAHTTTKSTSYNEEAPAAEQKARE